MPVVRVLLFVAALGACSSPWLVTPTAASDWTHNGSIVSLQANGAERKFLYKAPRSGLAVQSGTLLFEGKKSGDSYSGTAYVFRKECAPAGYLVSGPVASDQRRVTMHGRAPRLDASCKVIGYADDTLVFVLEEPRIGSGSQVVHNTPEGDRYLSCDDKRRMGYVLDEYEIDYCGGLPRKGQLNDAIPSNTIVFSIRSQDRYKVELSFYSASNPGQAWPGGNQVYILTDSEFHDYRLQCQPGEKVCYGAWRAGNPNSWWGSGYRGQKACDNCCGICGSGPHRHTLLAGSDDAVASGGGGRNVLDTLLEAGALGMGIAAGVQGRQQSPARVPSVPRSAPTYPHPQGADGSKSGISGRTR